MDAQYPLALPVGTVLAGQYVIEKVLGEGGFGITYYAKDHKSGGGVAIKEYFPDSMATRTQSAVVPYTGDRGDNYEYGKECFLQEAETLAQFIGNENIVRIYSFFEENGTAYYVMDYVEGMGFDAYITDKGGKLSFEETLRILAPVMEVLSLVHSRGIIHRDVTPDNIFITNEGTTKLLDFGAARYSLGDKSQSLDVILKHGFAPKEQYVRRGKQGPFTDVYALGATFYFALTGKRPPDSIERMDVDELVPPSSLGVDLPKEAEQAILMALNVQPADRFQSMQAFRSALGQTPQNVVKPTVQRFFTAPDHNDSVSKSFSDNKTEGILKNNVTRMPSIVINGVDCSSKGREFLNKAESVIENNQRIIRILVAVLFAALFIHTAKDNLQFFTELEFISVLSVIVILIERAVLAVAVYRDNRKLYIYGFGARICDMVIWILTLDVAQPSKILYIIAETALAVFLLMSVMRKRIQTNVLYIIGIVSVLLLILLKGDIWFWLETILFILLITIITHKQGGEKNGFN